MDDELQTIEDSFDLIPEEVQEYIYSDAFENDFNTVCADIGIDDEKKKLLKGTLFGYIAQITPEEELWERIENTTDDIVKRKKISDWIAISVIKKIFDLVTKAYATDEANEEEISTEATPSTVSPSLTTLADRLKKASVATPIQKHEAVLDPYHEPIDN